MALGNALVSGHVWATSDVTIRCVRCGASVLLGFRAIRRRLRAMGLRVNAGRLHLSCEAQQRVCGERAIWRANGRFVPYTAEDRARDEAEIRAILGRFE